MGVCGVGVAGVARLLQARGWQVSGCDASPDGAMARWLQAQGIAVLAKHDAGHVGCGGAGGPALPDQAGEGQVGRGRRTRRDEDVMSQGRSPSLLVHTAAVPGDHTEIVRAREAGYTVCRRGEALAALVDGCRGVAICGAHGKTTTTCFATRLLQELGASPSWCVGGSTAALGGVAGVGSSDLLVVEADESDGTLALYHPAVTVLNNIDLDHLEHFDGEAALVACYRQVVQQTRLGLAYGADDARACEVARAFRGPSISFGLCKQAVLRATQLELGADGIAFTVMWQGREWGRVQLRVPGQHNVLNALGALAASLLLEHDVATALALLPRVAELPARRFERVGAGSGIEVISDYAHHPAEIVALVAAARLQGARRVLAVFQPHRYTRTRALGVEFPAAFEGVDELVLTPVYAASEPPLEGGSIADLYAHFRRLRPALSVLLARSLEEAWAGLRRRLQPGDLLLVVGAGDVVKIAGWAAATVQDGTWGAGAPVTEHGRTSPSLGRRASSRAADEDLQLDECARDDNQPCTREAALGPGRAGATVARARPEPSASDFALGPGRVGATVTIQTLADALRRIDGVAVSVARPLAALTYYGVGGPADVLAEVSTPAALGALLAWTAAQGVPVHLLGRGANTWVSDLGVAGVVVRLQGEAFRRFAQCGDKVEIGCGWNGPALLDRLEAEGVAGLEFLEGVPGQVGGWLAMNAGAHGQEIGAFVERILCWNADGSCCEISVCDAGFRYRGCEALTTRVVWQVVLRLQADTPEAIRARRQAFRELRLPLAGLRTAGSVFCNPPGDFAGRLLDVAGCKGLQVGGASVSERHANIVVAGEGATASDILALLALMRQRVQACHSVRLALENRMLGLVEGADGLERV